MKLVNMKSAAGAAEKDCAPCAMGDAPRYPWGLSLTLDNEGLEKLGLDDLPEVGATMTLTARVAVTACSMNQSEGGDERRSVSLQITDMALDAGKKKSAESALYGDD